MVDVLTVLGFIYFLRLLFELYLWIFDRDPVSVLCDGGVEYAESR